MLEKDQLQRGNTPQARIVCAAVGRGRKLCLALMALDSLDGVDGNDVAQVIGDAGVTLNLAQSHIEAVVGGCGDDIVIGGGWSSVFINAGNGAAAANASDWRVAA